MQINYIHWRSSSDLSSASTIHWHYSTPWLVQNTTMYAVHNILLQKDIDTKSTYREHLPEYFWEHYLIRHWISNLLGSNSAYRSSAPLRAWLLHSIRRPTITEWVKRNPAEANIFPSSNHPAPGREYWYSSLEPEPLHGTPSPPPLPLLTSIIDSFCMRYIRPLVDHA